VRWIISRLRTERGATAVLMAVLMVPLIGFLGISVDVGALYAERAQLQNGADAAALAIARDCAARACGTPSTRAAALANANANDGTANVLTPVVTAGSVTVTSSTRDGGGNAMSHPFAALIGATPTTVRAQATAVWDGPSRSAVVLPLAVSFCEFRAALDGRLQLIRYDQNLSCPGRDGHPIPGGFGWLQPTSGTCSAVIDITRAQVPSDPGNDFPGTGHQCDSILTGLEGQTVLVPIFDGAPNVTRPVAWYHIYAFAAFTVTGWRFSGGGAQVNTDPAAPACTGSCRGIQGFFDHWVSLDAAGIELGGPDLGASFVRLTN
jgi:Flp pilus assembly protein TadG